MHGRLQWFNIFDATIVALSVIDLCLVSIVDTGENLSVLRGFRVIRVLRVLRVARSLKLFASLRMLCACPSVRVGGLLGLERWSMPVVK